jgi:hypothetical protein
MDVESVIVAKDKRYKASRPSHGHLDSLDALLAESRSLREQAADDLNREAKKFRKMSRHLGRGRARSYPNHRST